MSAPGQLRVRTLGCGRWPLHQGQILCRHPLHKFPGAMGLLTWCPDGGPAGGLRGVAKVNKNVPVFLLPLSYTLLFYSLEGAKDKVVQVLRGRKHRNPQFWGGAGGGGGSQSPTPLPRQYLPTTKHHWSGGMGPGGAARPRGAMAAVTEGKPPGHSPLMVQAAWAPCAPPAYPSLGPSAPPSLTPTHSHGSTPSVSFPLRSSHQARIQRLRRLPRTTRGSAGCACGAARQPGSLRSGRSRWRTGRPLR